MKKLTEWFPSRMKPVREGVYKTRADGLGEGFSLWRDGKWSNQRGRASEIRTRDWLYTGIQGKEWRGLTKPPK